MLGRQLTAVVQVAGLGNEVWGDRYLINLRGFAKWTHREGLAYIYIPQQVVLRPQSHDAIHFFPGKAYYAEPLIMGHICCCILINKRSPLLSMN